jgi:superfamily II DNA or RNA helicase
VSGEPLEYPGGWTYEIFFSGNDIQWVNEGALESIPASPPIQVVGRDGFLRALLLTKLDNPLSDLLYAYQASRTQFEAYQFKPVLKFLEAPVPAILIADEVGLGKTIEAGILYQELKARTRVTRVLVVCPAGLRLKWQAELASRFDEQFAILRATDIKTDAQEYLRNEGTQPLHGIVGLESIRARRLQPVLRDSGVRYDLVIVDEAHHLRTSGTLSNAVGERLSLLADNLVLLTATPLQTSQADLYQLLAFTDPSQFTDYDDFLAQLAPNARLNAAIRALRTLPPDASEARQELQAIHEMPAGAQVLAHPNFRYVLQALHDGPLDRETVVHLQRDIDRMNVLSSIYTRTRKGDISRVARRKAYAIQAPLTEQERAFYEAVLAHARAQAMARSMTGWIPGFVGMMRERQAASCIAAFREYLREAYGGHATLTAEDSSPDVSPDEPDTLRVAGGEREALGRLLGAADALGAHDSKLGRFLTLMDEILPTSAGQKVIVFSYFRRTLNYLARELRAAGKSVVLIHGDVPPQQRAVLIDRFREDPGPTVMLTSEVGAEGLDFQFCDTLVNYDLPWNPMKVEQRIGRIDRYGQQREQVRIYSLFLQGTIEERILERLYERIGIFEDSIGDLEPILGPIAAELTREVFSAELSEAEEAAVLERVGAMLIARRLEERELEARQVELLGQDSLLMQAISDNVASGRYVSAAELRAAVDGFLHDRAPGSLLVDQVGDGTVLLKADGMLADIVEADLQTRGDTRPVAIGFLRKLRGSAGLPATFDGERAVRTRRLELLNLRHPLIQLAVEHHRRKDAGGAVPVADLWVNAATLPASLGPWPGTGRYEFAVFLLSVTAAQPQTRLVPIAFDETGRRATACEDRLLRLLQQHAVDRPGDSRWTIEDRDRLFRQAKIAVSGEAGRVEAEVTEKNAGVIAVRRATLERTTRARIERHRRVLGSVLDERIQRLHVARIRNLETELERRIADLESRRNVTVTSAPIGIGRLDLVAGASPPDPPAVPADRMAPVAEEERVIDGFPEPPARFA